MAKTTKTRRKVARISSTHEQKIRAAMGKTIREVRRNADINKIKLAVADKKIVVYPQIVRSRISCTPSPVRCCPFAPIVSNRVH